MLKSAERNYGLFLLLHVGQGKFDLVKELYFVLRADKAETTDEGLCTEMLS